MHKFLVTLVVGSVSCAPIAARAEQQLMVPVQQRVQATPASDTLDSNKLLAIGIGVVVGYALASTVWTIQGTTLLGAVAGGLLGNWWYENRSADIVPLDKPSGAPRTR